MLFKNLAAVIHTCDSYSWIWDTFYHFWNKNWNIDCPVYFCNEELYFKLNQIKTGSGSWSERLYKALLEIQENDILYFQEDFLIKRVNYDWLAKSYEIHKKHNNDLTKLGTNYEFEVSIVGQDFLPILTHTRKSEYIYSHQPVTICKRDFLLDILKDRKIGPSEAELQITKEINYGLIKCKQMCIGPIFIPNKSIIIEIEHCIRQGQLIDEAKNFILKEGLQEPTKC